MGGPGVKRSAALLGSAQRGPCFEKKIKTCIFFKFFFVVCFIVFNIRAVAYKGEAWGAGGERGGLMENGRGRNLSGCRVVGCGALAPGEDTRLRDRVVSPVCAPCVSANARERQYSIAPGNYA